MVCLGAKAPSWIGGSGLKLLRVAVELETAAAQRCLATDVTALVED
jgi:hypothetical protein